MQSDLSLLRQFVEPFETVRATGLTWQPAVDVAEDVLSVSPTTEYSSNESGE